MLFSPSQSQHLLPVCMYSAQSSDQWRHLLDSSLAPPVPPSARLHRARLPRGQALPVYQASRFGQMWATRCKKWLAKTRVVNKMDKGGALASGGGGVGSKKSDQPRHGKKPTVRYWNGLGCEGRPDEQMSTAVTVRWHWLHSEYARLEVVCYIEL